MGGDGAAVETTAYALLAMLSSGARSEGGHLADALPAARWLIQQRNSNGGFRSTQDTVVGLESLSSFAALAYQSGVDLTVTISSLDSDWQESVRVSNGNRDVVQRLELPLGQRFRPRRREPARSPSLRRSNSTCSKWPKSPGSTSR